MHDLYHLFFFFLTRINQQCVKITWQKAGEEWNKIVEGEVLHIAAHGMPKALGIYNMFYGEPEGPVNC